MPKDEKQIKETDQDFEDLFETQVHLFMDEHLKLIDKEQNVFKMAKDFEHRYEYVIETAKQKSKELLMQVKNQNEKLKTTLLENRQRLIQETMEHLEKDIKKSMEEHNAIQQQEGMKLDTIYQNSEKDLIKKIVELMGLNFK